MSARQPRFEICRGDDGDAQPWWARYRAANGRIVWVTENYARRQAAEWAVLTLARTFWCAALFSKDGTRLHLDRYETTSGIEVRRVDER